VDWQGVRAMFETLIENGAVQQEDYDHIRGGTTLFDCVYQKLILQETRAFTFDSDDPFSVWPDLHEEVDPDDALQLSLRMS
jgi:hypothetical protein